MGKKQSIPLGVSNPPPGLGVAPERVIPDLLREDRRVFCGFIGSSASVTQTFYQVPPGKIYVVENIIKVFDNDLTPALGDNSLQFTTSGDKEILRIEATNGGSDPNSVIKQPMKLIAGDKIKVLYRTTDAAGRFVWSISGIEQINPLSYGL